MVQGWIRIQTNKLVKAPWNYKEDDLSTHYKLTQNIKNNGLIENLIVRELPNDHFEIVNGNHRYDSILKNGLDHIMCYNLGQISEVEAERVAFETNETRFESDDAKLNNMLSDLMIEFGKQPLLTTMPFSPKKMDEIDALLNSVEGEDELFNDVPELDDVLLDDKMLVLMLNKDDAENFHSMINRFKKLLYPSFKPEDLTNLIPIQAIVLLLKSIPEERLLGINGGI